MPIACFGAMQQANKQHVGLGIDATNETDAVRLYARIGMHCIATTIAIETELRAAAERVIK